MVPLFGEEREEKSSEELKWSLAARKRNYLQVTRRGRTVVSNVLSICQRASVRRSEGRRGESAPSPISGVITPQIPKFVAGIIFHASAGEMRRAEANQSWV